MLGIDFFYGGKMSRPVIVALDLDNEKKLNELLPKLGKPENVFIKIGM